MERTWPVIHEDSAETKNRTPFAMSSGSPSRRRAMLSISVL
jgi:hypothetical protein